VQIRVTLEGKKAMDLLQEKIYRERGMKMSMGEVLLEILLESHPDVIHEAVRELEKQKDGE
jgi:hypothetical protein